MPMLHFLFDGLRAMRRGSRAYWTWVGGLGCVGIPLYVLFSRDRGRESVFCRFFPWVLLAMFRAIAIPSS
jgi:hypothetical protein